MNGWFLITQQIVCWITRSEQHSSTYKFVSHTTQVHLHRPSFLPVLLRLDCIHYILFTEQKKSSGVKGTINPQMPLVFSVGCLAVCKTELPLLFPVSVALRTAAYSDITMHFFSCSLLCHGGKKTFSFQGHEFSSDLNGLRYLNLTTSFLAEEKKKEEAAQQSVFSPP